MNTLSLMLVWLSKDPFLHVIWLTGTFTAPVLWKGEFWWWGSSHMVEPASNRGKVASVLPFASAHRSVTPPRRGSVQDKAQKCYPPESSKKSLPELSRNLIPNGAGNLLQPIPAQALSLLLRSSCGCSMAWLASHEQRATLLSSLLLTEKARIQSQVQ